MKIVRFWEYQREAGKLYKKKKYQEVIDLLKEVDRDFPHLKTPVYYLGMFAALELEKPDLVIELFKTVIDEGGWFVDAIVKDPSFKDLEKIEEFENLVKISLERAEDYAETNHHMQIIPDKLPAPFILSLHADGGNLKEELKELEGMVDQNYQIGLPRSKNVYWSGDEAAYWPSPEKTIAEIEEYIKTIDKEKIDFSRSIITGLSKGGGAAIIIALSGVLPIRRFIAVGPGGMWDDDVEELIPLIEKADKNIEGIIVHGKEDRVIPREKIVELLDVLNTSGISCKMIEYDDLGHWYPPDFSELISSFLSE
jgi:predicted esterase